MNWQTRKLPDHKLHGHVMTISRAVFFVLGLGLVGAINTAQADSLLGIDFPKSAYEHCPNIATEYFNTPNDGCPVDITSGYQSYSIPPPADLFGAGVLGDSISVGRYADPQSAAYPNIVYEGLKALYPGGYIWKYNGAEDGATTNRVKVSQVPRLMKYLRQINRPVIIGITAGGNDFLNELGQAQSENRAPDYESVITRAKGNLIEIVNMLKEAPGGVWIYVAVVFDPTDGAGYANTCQHKDLLKKNPSSLPCALAKLRAEYLTLARNEEKLSVIDALGAFHGHGAYFCDTASPYYNSANPTLWLNPDCAHPNNRGHAELGRLFLEAISNQTTVGAR